MDCVVIHCTRIAPVLSCQDVMECAIDRVIVGEDTGGRIKAVLLATAGVLDSIAHTFLFHAALAWLVPTHRLSPALPHILMYPPAHECREML